MALIYDSNLSLPSGIHDNDYGFEYYIKYFDGTEILNVDGSVLFTNGDNGITLPESGIYLLECFWDSGSDMTVFSISSSIFDDSAVVDSGYNAKRFFINKPIGVSGVSFIGYFNVFDNGMVYRENLTISNWGVIDNSVSTIYCEILKGEQFSVLRHIQQICYPSLLNEFPPSSSSSTSDLSSLSTEIEQKGDEIISNITSLNNSLSGLINGLDGSLSGTLSGFSSSIDGSMNGIHSHLDSIDTKLDDFNFDIDLNSIEFISLNGTSGSIPDNTVVNVSGYTNDFTVISSQMLKNDTTLYLVIYILEDENGKRFLIPSTAVTIKV